MLKNLLIFVIVILFVGCGGTSTGKKVKRKSGNVISAEELATLPGQDLKMAIEYLRPGFLRLRPAASLRSAAAATPVVYVDNMRRGGVDVLNSILVSTVQQVTYLSPGDATFKYGTNHPGGVIAVKTK